MKKGSEKANTPSTKSATQTKSQQFFDRAVEVHPFIAKQKDQESINEWLDRNASVVLSPFINDSILVSYIRKEINVPYTNDYIIKQISNWRILSRLGEPKTRPKEHFYFIHGTGSTPKVWKKNDGKIIEMMSEAFGEENNQDVVHLLKWSGANNSHKREKAIEKFVDLIYTSHKDFPEESIIITGHSHGGNIALDVVNRIAFKLPNTLIKLITLNTPVRSDYQPKFNDKVKHYNFFIGNDDIQKKEAGYDETGKIYDPDSGNARLKAGLPPKGYLKRKIMVLIGKKLQHLADDLFDAQFTIGWCFLPKYGGEFGKAGNKFEGAVNIEVWSPVVEGAETIWNKPLRHRLWHKKNLEALEIAMYPYKEPDYFNLKGRNDFQELMDKYALKVYKNGTKDNDFDIEANKDAASMLANLSRNAKNYLRSEEGKLLLSELKSYSKSHSFILFSKLWKEAEYAAKLKESVDNKDGLMQMIMLIEPFYNKTYRNPTIEPETKIPNKDLSKSNFIDLFKQYDQEAVKDCFSIVKKLNEDAFVYLDSETGKVLLDELSKMQVGHALWLFSNNWRSAEQHLSKSKIKEAKHVAKMQKSFGKTGKEINKLIAKETTNKKLSNYVKDAVKPKLSKFVENQKEIIENKRDLNHPDYSAKDAEKDIHALKNLEEIIKGIEDDILEYRSGSNWVPDSNWIFDKVRDATASPDFLKALMIFLVNPAATQPNPDASSIETLAVYGTKKALNTPIKEGKLPFGTEKKGGNVTVKARSPLTPINYFIGEEHLTLDLLKSVSNKLNLQGGISKQWKITTNNEFNFPDEASSSPSVIGKTGFNFTNINSGKTFFANAEYEVKKTGYAWKSNQTVGDKKGSFKAEETYEKNQDAEKKSVGFVIENINKHTFKQSFKVNLSNKEPGTASAGLGATFILNKSKTFSIDSNFTLPLGDKSYVKELATYLEYKDSIEFLNMAASFYLENKGQLQIQDFAIALKKTWQDVVKNPSKNTSKDVSFYLSGSLGLNDGKPARWSAQAGAEINFKNNLRKENKYGVFTQIDLKKSESTDTNVVFIGSAGITRDKLQFGPYLSNNPADLYGLRVLIKFSAPTSVRTNR